MLLGFFDHLKKYRVPVSVRELLDCLAVLNKRLVFANLGDFYFLSRMTLVKDEKYFDRFDLAFSTFFSDTENEPGLFEDELPLMILNDLLNRYFPDLSASDRTRVLIEYQARLTQQPADQQTQGKKPKNPESADNGKRVESGLSAETLGGVDEASHDGRGDEVKNGEDGSAGEEGSNGENGESGEGDEGKEGKGRNGEEGLGASDEPGQGIRDDTDMVSQRSAMKLWHQRQFEDYDPEVELGTRNIKMALRRLRKFARTAAEVELDLLDTIARTARNGGFLDIKEVPERHNAVKVLLFLDVGGSMDDHIELCSQLFAAARSEFKYLQYYYFHNFVYESVWLSNDRRQEDKLRTFDLIRRYGSDYKIIFVGDANMAHREVSQSGGSVEHFNAEAGEIWLSRLQTQFKKIVWLNPVEKRKWQDSQTIGLIQQILDGQMYHLSVDGIEQAMKYLTR